MTQINVQYSATVTSASRELTAREKLQVTDTNALTPLRESVKQTEDNKLTVQPAGWIIVDVYNEKAEGDTEYKQYIIEDSTGVMFYTGSETFFNSFMQIWEVMKDEGEDYEIEVYEVPSKNRQGQFFLTCSIV